MKKYFYRNGDRIEKYVYCTRGCQEAYKQIDIGSTILKVNNTTFICLKCIKTLGIKTQLHSIMNMQTKEIPFTFSETIPNIAIDTISEIKIAPDIEKEQTILETVSGIETEQVLETVSDTETEQVLESTETLDQNIQVPAIGTEFDKEPVIQVITEEQITTEIELVEKDVQVTTIEKNSETMSDNTESEFFVFVLKCKDETFYVGATSNVEKAIKYHNQGCGTNYTRPKERRPVSLVEFQKTTPSKAKKLKDVLSKKYGI